MMRTTRSKARAQAHLLKQEEEGEEQQAPLLQKIEATESKPALISTDKEDEKDQKKKKKKKRTASQANLDIDPFPDWPGPTREQCEEVHALLAKLHGDVEVPPLITDPAAAEAETAATKRTRSVLHSVVRTILSCNTTAANSQAATQGLAREFPSRTQEFDDGVDYEQVRTAEFERVCDAIRPAGLAKIRGKNIQTILDIIYHENMQRKQEEVDVSKPVKSDADGDANAPTIKHEKEEEEEEEEEEKEEGKPASLTTLSLEHLRSLSTPDAQEHLMRFPGVGVKVAACVLLFNLHRPVFAVDTHIFRLSKWLGWAPAEKSNEITAFRHLQARIPDHLMYPLHILLVMHGRRCGSCKAVMSRGKGKGKGGEEECPLEHLMKRFRKPKKSKMD